MKYLIEPDFIYAELSKMQAAKLNAVWNQKRSMYRMPNTIHALRELFQLNRDPKIVKYGSEKAKKRDEMLTLKQLEDAPGDERLRPYQRVDVNYLKNLKAAGIFNQMRTGKTPTTLLLTKAVKTSKLVIVAPASLLMNWQEEIKRWKKERSVILQGSKIKRKALLQAFQVNQKSTVIISYETLRNDIDDFMKILANTKFTLVLDEAHRLRNHKSKQSKAVFNLGRIAERRYALTGTPTVRSGDEIYGILHFLYPNKFPGYWQFVERYFDTKDAFFGGKEIQGYKRQEELEDLITLVSTNRKRKEVMKWLPPKQYQTITLDMDKKQKKHYDDMLNTFEADHVDAPNPLVQLTRLRQITTAPETLELDAPSSKEKFILEWLDDNPNEQVIIFSMFSSYLSKIHAKLTKTHKAGIITGNVSKEDRDRQVKQFQEGKLKVLFANIKAAGTGLTLDKGETVIFIDKEWNPSDNAQAEDRIIPTSEERSHSCSIISLVCKDTYDEVIEALLKQKVNITKVINNGGINGLRRLLDGKT